MGGDDEDTAHSSPSSSSSVSAELRLALGDFCGEGYGKLSHLLQVLHKEKIISDPMLQTLLFVGLGGYFHFFSAHFNETGMAEESHIHAVGMVMKNPRVGNLVEQMMSQTIASKISGVVE
tara:strand:+ start:652 stop:1011 length:360 start_codon:yes stop_codon:yes gene_type:complete